MKRVNVVIIVILVVALIGALVAYTLRQQAGTDIVQVTHKETQRPTQKKQSTKTLTSVKGVKIVIDNWPEDNVIATPLTITGKVPGNWSSEGVFPISVTYEGDISIPGAIAKLDRDWMTDKLVPFTAVLDFDKTTMQKEFVTLVFRNANPSGNTNNDDSATLPIRF